MSDPVLALRGVSVSYGKIEAVRQASLTVGAGQIVTVVGANGAGKSSLLNAAMGVLPCEGEVAFAGRALGDAAVEDRVAAGMTLVPEKRELFPSMAVEDNLRLGAYRRRDGWSRSLERVYDLFPRLKERRRQLAGTLSGGERQMLAMGRALMGRPRLLMLDEPSLGLAPRIVRDILQLVARLREDGTAVLLIEQNARAALQVADYGYVMELGRVILEGSAADLTRDERVIQSYLGARAVDAGAAEAVALP